MTPAILTLLPSAHALGERIAALTEGEHLPAANHDASAAETLRALFAAGRPIIGVCAAGVLMRALAPLIADKRREPPVLAVSADGAAVVPLLGGHHGANALARRLAAALGATAAITTASDAVHGVALDQPPPGWRLANPEAAKTAMARIAAGARVTVESGPAPGAAMGDWLAPLIASGAAPRAVRRSGVSIYAVQDGTDGAALHYAAQDIALGVGCARGCPPQELIDLVNAALAEAGAAPEAIACVVSLDLKSDEAAVHALAAHLDVPARFFPADRLEQEAPRLATPSETVFNEVGCHGVAEGAALAAAGPDSLLTLPKRKSANATCALARAAAPIAALTGALPGIPRGRLSVVGIGPGQSDWRTPEASRLIAEAEELVGYGLYIDLLGPLASGKPRADFPLGGEEDRCRYALEAASKGRNIALICSGDSGIYAMGALLQELLARGGAANGVSPAARRVEVVNAPGVTALQAASARVGALIGHDFCAISLSDLLTPREDILKRLHAAAEGDFVTALYNPVSKRRRTLLAEAQTIFARRRPAGCPVLLAQNLGRPDETLRRRTLDTLNVDEVDMLTVVLIGAAQSQSFETGDGGWKMFTPRGYARKTESASS